MCVASAAHFFIASEVTQMKKQKTKIARALNCQIAVEIYDMMEEFCEDVGQTKTAMIERAVREYVQNHREEQSKLREQKE